MRALKTLFLFLLLTFPTTLFAAEVGMGPVDQQYRLAVTVDIAVSRITGTLTVPVKADEPVRLETGQLDVLGLTINGKPATPAVVGGALTIFPAASGTADVRYAGTFSAAEAMGDRNFGVVSSVINDKGISLTGIWHPRPVVPGSWTLTATFPAGYEAVAESEEVVRTEQGKTVTFLFRFPHPVGSMTLVATDRYEVHRERFGDRDLWAYFFPEDRELAKTYLQHAKRYLDMYEKMLGPYPYRRFAIVENFLPTGYSMPTFTLLGQEVVRLPFIVETSLGHEILHQWFGNSVFCDSSGGNWTEGLTTYLADHWYEEENGKGWEYRKQLLVNYEAYVHGAKDVPLREFQGRTDLASRSIGYGKAAMVFHMLRRSLGDELFFAALREFVQAERFREASWRDIEKVMTKHAGRDLAPFFRQWIDRPGLPAISVENLSLRRSGSEYEIAFDVVRKDLALPLELPVTIVFRDGKAKKEHLTVEADRQHRTLNVDAEPLRAIFDEDYDVARSLTVDEFPPVIARISGAEKPIIVLPAADRGRYQPVIDEFRKQGGGEKNAAELRNEDVSSSSVVVLGGENPVLARLFGGPVKREGGFSIVVRKNPWNEQKVIAVIDASSAEECQAAFGKIFHYGKYSKLVFENGRNREKRIDASDRGIIWEIGQEPVVLDMSLLRRLSAALETASSRRIVYVGEFHDRFSNHDVELQVIEAMHGKDPMIAVGMEMFQRPFQKVIDDYIGGNINEREFLQGTEYFKRWGFDYNLYKPILDFCRRNKVPVVALNMRSEIIDKVSEGGIDALSDDERKELPSEMDFSDDAYRERIRQAYAQHQGQERSFASFLQAQVIWDETMAESIDGYLSDHPERRLIVIAGGGHLVYSNGIPARAFRRNGLSHTIILNDVEIDPGIADFVVQPQPLDGKTAPKLMLTFRDTAGELRINDFIKGSPARKAGLRSGDRLIALDGVPVSGVQDVKLALFFKRPGDAILVTVERERFLFGTKVMTLEVAL